MKNIHGQPTKFYLKQQDVKPLMDHKTLFRIKLGINGSGNSILLIAKILNQSGVKVEAHFQDALFEKNHILEDFFDIKSIDLEIYGQPDFQLWQFTKGLSIYYVSTCRRGGGKKCQFLLILSTKNMLT